MPATTSCGSSSPSSRSVLAVLHIFRLLDAGQGGEPEQLALHDHVLQGYGVLWLVLMGHRPLRMTLTVDVSPRLLSGWGRTTPTTTMVTRPIDARSIEAALRTHTPGVIARGLGRSYGDAAQCSGGLTIDLTGLDQIGAIDEDAGTIEVGGGVSLHDLMRSIIPAGWFVAVTPGTRYVSVGGAIAADVHGKNHHRDSSFARHVVEMTLATPAGTFTVSPENDAELVLGHRRGHGPDGRRAQRHPAADPDRDVMDAGRQRALHEARRPDVHHGGDGSSLPLQRGVARLRRPPRRRPSLGPHPWRPRPLRCAPGPAAWAQP